MKHILGLLAVATILSACDGGTDPVIPAPPEGTFTRVAQIGERTLHSTFTLTADSGSIRDTLFASTGAVDSTHATELELNPAGDGYLRAVETHDASGSDVTEHVLRYWYFYERNDSLFYFRGMRFRGNNPSIIGDWHISNADSAYIGVSYTYLFADDSVTIITDPGADTTLPYMINRDTLRIEGTGFESFGPRYELIPALAVYITTRANVGYRRVGE